MQAPSENSFGGEPIEDPRRLAVQHFLKKLLGWHPVPPLRSIPEENP
jgi:hypothetical protein